MTHSHPLTDWFKSMGVELHRSLYLKQDPKTGLSFYSSAPLPKNTTAVTVPASLCITSKVAHRHICELITSIQGPETPGKLPSLGALPTPDWILLYLVLCRLVLNQNQTEWGEHLPHLPYVSHLPTVIPTPLHFSNPELDLLSSTPLLSFAELRLKETKVDYVRAALLMRRYLESSEHGLAKHIIDSLDVTPITDVDDSVLFSDIWLDGLELWRWAESVLTSRSFPSILIGLTGTSDSPDDDLPLSTKEASSRFPVYSSKSSYPILIPAYDMFNHERARAVTWSHLPADPATASSSTEKETKGKLAMILEYDTPVADTQVFNNYGGKSNEEFLAAYGFTLATTTEDSLALKLSATSRDAPIKQRGEPSTMQEGAVGKSQTYYWTNTDRDNELNLGCPTELIKELEYWTHQTQLDPQPAGTDIEALFAQAKAYELLERCLLTKRKAFKASQARIDSLIKEQPLQTNIPSTWNPRSPSSHIRASVWSNVSQYRAGQIEILNKAVAWTQKQLEEIAERIDTLSMDSGDQYSDPDSDWDRPSIW